MELEHQEHNTLKLKKLGVDFRNEHLVFMRRDCHVCKSEGFEALNRIRVSKGDRTLVASLIVMDNPSQLNHGEIGLSNGAIEWLSAGEGDEINLSHMPPLDSMSDVRRKIYGDTLEPAAFSRIIQDIAASNLSNIQLSAFISACVGEGLNADEVIALTRAMIDVGFRLEWAQKEVFDKHCIGGLPGNRTTPIVVAIVAAAGLTIPKTSSRAITSPAGTADTMETLTNVNLSVEQMKNVVNQEGGCLVWGGSVQLSPADDIIIRVEKALDIDSEGQLIASVLSKKAAAGSTHVVIDIPVGPTAKVRSEEAAKLLSEKMIAVGIAIGLNVVTVVTDGRQPIGRGIGPSLEALDVLAVLQNDITAPKDLRQKAVLLAGKLLEMGGKVSKGEGEILANEILHSGKAWEKFQQICIAQGGLKTPKTALYTQIITADKSGMITAIDNRKIAKVAKLAGAPDAATAGIYLSASIGLKVEKGQNLYKIYAESPGELAYAIEYLRANPDIIQIEA
uniref:thymidine phosphorylase n=1 Tax=Candidatus Criblamydia sequanensis CRIB-18 TaxID=1437425 RepID=A0A090E482_9BACT|nr:thymidine phosphorylase family protein [Criblamydia sequanensis]CDR35280.1 Putative thymidine phosphorylase [Criblamydia sequanensis CRIB-18]